MALKNAGQNRKFGIELVGNIPWGTHLCQFYQTKQDLIDILVPYFAQGLHSNEYCIWVTSPPLESDQAKKALRKAVPDLDDYVAKGQIESISYGDWYFQGGKFVGAQVLKAWIEKEAAALKAGFKGLRISGNTLWEEKLWPSFIDYEEAINSILRQRKILALCTYSLSKCNGSEVIDVIRNHVGTLIKQDKKWGLIEEMAERKKTEEALSRLNRHLRAISNSNQALMKASDQTKFIQEVYNIIVHDCGYELVWVGLAKDDEQKSVVPVAYAGFDEGYIRALNVTWSADSERGHGPTGTAIRMGKRYVCKDMTRDATFKPWLKQATDRGYKSCAVLPLVDFDGKTFGVLSIYSSELDSFSEEELKLLTELANDFAYGLTTLKLRQEKQYAEELTRKQASLIDLCPDAIIVKKMNGEITFWSEGAEKLYGWTKQEAIGQKTQTMLRTKFPASKENLLEELKRTGNWTGELVHRTKDGQKRVVQSYWRTTVNNRGVAEEIMETNVDVTDRKEMQNKLEEYTAHLEKLVDDRTQQLKDTERLTAIGETAGMVGHDLRNPLQTITGEMYLAKAELAELPDGPQKFNLQETVSTIADQVSYMNKIVSDLQDFVKPISPEKTNIDVTKLIVDTFKDVPVPANVHAISDLEESLPMILADAQLLRRVLFNLFNNAVQAMPSGGTLNVVTKLKREPNGQGTVMIMVEDTGEGISDAIRGKIFKPLFTTKSKGQGFGLAVCKRAIEAHGGIIRFESQAGRGTRFFVELPTS